MVVMSGVYRVGSGGGGGSNDIDSYPAELWLDSVSFQEPKKKSREWQGVSVPEPEIYNGKINAISK